MLDQNTFIETVQSVAEIIRTSAEPIGRDEIMSYFKDMELNKAQEDMVFEFLITPHEQENESAGDYEDESHEDELHGDEASENAALNNVIYTLDTGHYEPTENVSDAVSALLLYVPELMLHVSRPMHWDSDHVTLFDDNTRNLFSELVRANALDRAHIGLDYFDASINRIGAYIVGVRAAQKSLLQAFLEPLDILRKYEDEGKLFERLALLEEAKTLPMGAVYDYFNLKNNIPVGEEYIADVEKYEAEVLSKRN